MATIEDLLQGIQGEGMTTTAELARTLGVTPHTVTRLIKRAGDRVLSLGKGPARRHTIPRILPSVGSRIPVARVDENGQVSQHGVISLPADEGYWLTRVGGQESFYTGLPPFAADMRPQGFIGRGFPGRYPELGLPAHVSQWNDDHHMIALARRGEDCVGDLIIGEESFSRFLLPVQHSTRADYPGLARGTLSVQAGSSAGGEQPKFLTFAEGKHRLVKFVGGDGAAADRWRDLLVAEHTALEVIREAGVVSAHSEWFDMSGFRFLEVERFDRVGERGRRGVMTLATANDHFVGWEHDSWRAAGVRLLVEPDIHIGEPDVLRLHWLDSFGELIWNNDRHFHNILFFCQEDARPSLSLAPVYDMLPMAFAPKSTIVADTHFRPRPTTLTNLTVWAGAARWASVFWERLAQADGLTEDFRSVSRECLAVVEEMRAALGE